MVQVIESNIRPKREIIQESQRGDHMAVLESVKGMTLKQQACMLYLPCSDCTDSHYGTTQVCHRVRDLVHCCVCEQYCWQRAQQCEDIGEA
jgi:hypothetical protein